MNFAGRQARRRRISSGGPDARAIQLLPKGIKDESVPRRIDHELPGFQRGSNLWAFFRKITPVAAMQAANRKIAAHPGGRRSILEQYLVIAHSGLEPLHLEQHIGP